MKMTVTADELQIGDRVFEPDNPEMFMYEVVDIRSKSKHRTIVLVMRRDGDMLRELPNTVEYPIERETL